MEKSKDFVCPSLEGMPETPSCEDGTFEASIVGALVSDLLNNGEKIVAQLTHFGDSDKCGEGLFDLIKEKY